MKLGSCFQCFYPKESKVLPIYENESSLVAVVKEKLFNLPLSNIQKRILLNDLFVFLESKKTELDTLKCSKNIKDQRSLDLQKAYALAVSLIIANSHSVDLGHNKLENLIEDYKVDRNFLKCIERIIYSDYGSKNEMVATSHIFQELWITSLIELSKSFSKYSNQPVVFENVKNIFFTFYELKFKNDPQYGLRKTFFEQFLDNDGIKELLKAPYLFVELDDLKV